MLWTRHNGGVSTPEPAAAETEPSPRTRWETIIAVWVAAVVAAVLIGIFSAPVQYSAWIALALAGCTIATLVIQLAMAEKRGFVNRLAISLVGSVAVLGVATAILWALVLTR